MKVNIHDSVCAIADFFESSALSRQDNNCSIHDLRSAFSAPDDEGDVIGTEEGDDRTLDKLTQALAKNSERKQHFQLYPFDVQSNSLSFNGNLEGKSCYYVFLLLATRLNMNTEKVQGGVDATKLFERLCKCVVAGYLGDNSKCEILGTSVGGSFREKVEDILQKLNIIGKYQEPDGGTGHHQDGAVDLVAWIPFPDKKDSQIIALGQCKTGTNWHDIVGKPDFFCLYSTKQPYVRPLYMLFVAEDFGIFNWQQRSSKAGILFDRRRILDFLPDDIESIDNTLDKDIHVWVNAALKYIEKI